MGEMEQNLASIYKVDKNIPIPLYYQLKEVVLEQIRNQTLKVGDALPTEIELCEVLNISRPTVRQAFTELVAEGYLNRKKGKGTYVAAPKVHGDFFNKLKSFNEEMVDKNLVPSTKVLELKMVAKMGWINSELKMSMDEELVKLSRVRYGQDSPLVVVDTYLPYDQFSGLLQENFEVNSLYTLLEDKYHAKVHKVSRTISAVTASHKDAILLDIPQGSAICFVKTVAMDEHNHPIEYSEARYAGERNEFTIELYA